MADFVETTTTTDDARTVKFLDKPEVFYPEEVKKTVPPAARKQRISRRERRNNAIAQQQAKEDAEIRFEKNFEIVKKFADQLTPEKLATEVKQYVSEGMEELGIKEKISGVPKNGRVPFSPISYCSDCVDRIAAYFKDQNMAKTILKNDDGVVEKQVYIKDVKKLASSFLNVQNLQFFDYVSIKAFNDNAMKRGGSMYDVPLSMACLADAAGGSGNLYEKLAGKETVCAAFSTGVAMQCVTAENSFKTHKQLLEENVDLDTIRSGCSCLKSDKWLKERVAVQKKMERLIQKKEEKVNWEDYDVSSCEQEDEEEDESEDEDSDEEEKEENYSDEEEIENEENSDDVKFELLDDDDDYNFHPGDLVQPVEKEEDFDNESWAEMRSTSTCLALCRHASSCVVNAINKARVLESLMLFRVDEKKGIASTTPGEYFSVISRPTSALIFSLGATVYEAFAGPDTYSDIECTSWSSASSNKRDNDDKGGLSSIKSSTKPTAKVYTTVHTVAAPFLSSAPVCYIDQQNKYGYYKTFRVRMPGNFSGYYNDTSVGWRSELYSRMTFSAAKAECRGDKKLHRSFLEEDEEFMAWPRRKCIKVDGGIVYDDSGDMSGNYLTFMLDVTRGGVAEKTAVTAYANMKNLTAVLKNMKLDIEELLMVRFKNQLVQLKTLDIERTQAEETAAAGGLSVHETQHLNDICTSMTQHAKTTARAIDTYKKILKSLERDLGTMNKHLSYHLKGYMWAAAAEPDIDDNVYDYYL